MGKISIKNMENKIKVLHIVTMFPRHEKDFGIAPWLFSYIKKLEELEIKNIVLAPSYRGLGDQMISGIDIRRFRYFNKRFENLTHEENAPTRIRRKPVYIFMVPFFIFAGYIKAKRIAKQENPNIFHIHWPFPMAMVSSFAFGNFPVIMKFYSAELALLKKFWIFKPIMRHFVEKSTIIISNSSFTARLVKEEFGRDSEILYDGYLFPDHPPEIKFPEPSKQKKILFVGRLVERKGVEYLLQAVKILQDKMDVQVKIVGDGVLLGKLKSLANELNITERTVFLGRVTDEERNKAYKECDIFVLPACYDRHGDTEGLGTVLLEALSAGKPVVGSNVGGIPDIIINNKTGLLVPEKDPLTLAYAIEKILTNKELYLTLASNGFEYAKNNFSIQAIAEKGKDLYLKAIELWSKRIR